MQSGGRHGEGGGELGFHDPHSTSEPNQAVATETIEDQKAAGKDMQTLLRSTDQSLLT